MKKESEFGKGLTYCLGLFLCHSERDFHSPPALSYDKNLTELQKAEEIIHRPSLWFYGAGDHLFDLEIPDTLSLNLQARLRKFQSKVLGWRLTMGLDEEPTKDDKVWAIQEAKDLLRAIDKQYGVDTIKGGWE